MSGYFSLPRVGPDVFSKLMRQAKLKYDREKRMFMVEPSTNVSVLAAILKEALNDDIIIELPCFVCGSSAGCAECEFVDVCDRASVSNQCICKGCSDDDGYQRYCNAFMGKLAAAKIKI